MSGDLVVTPQELWKFGTHQRAVRRTPLMLWSRCIADAAASRFSTFRLSGTQAGYAVTAARTLILTRCLVVCDTAVGLWSFGYSDADLGLSAAADGANPVNLDTPTAGARSVFLALTANTIAAHDVYYEIPAGKFPRAATAIGAATFTWMLFGHEV